MKYCVVTDPGTVRPCAPVPVALEAQKHLAKFRLGRGRLIWSWIGSVGLIIRVEIWGAGLQRSTVLKNEHSGNTDRTTATSVHLLLCALNIEEKRLGRFLVVLHSLPSRSTTFTARHSYRPICPDRGKGRLTLSKLKC